MCKSDKSQKHHYVYSNSMVSILKNTRHNSIFLHLKKCWEEIV